MSSKSLSTTLIVEHEGKVLYDSANAMERCSCIFDIKRYIERNFGMAIGSQMLTFENILLPDNIAPEDLKFKFKSALSEGNSSNTSNLNRPIKLDLNIFKGLVSIKVNIISNNREPIKQVMVVHAAISISHLRETLMQKLPEETQQKGKDTQIILFIKKK